MNWKSFPEGNLPFSSLQKPNNKVVFKVVDASGNPKSTQVFDDRQQVINQLPDSAKILYKKLHNNSHE